MSDTPSCETLGRLNGLPDPVAGEMPEMLWYAGSLPRSIRIDRPVDPGQGWPAHAHVFDEHGAETCCVNLDGSARHGSRGTLLPADMHTLAALGFALPDHGRVE